MPIRMLIVAAVFVMVSAPSLRACACIDQPLAKAFASSDSVFRARITSAREVRVKDDEHIDVEAHVLEMFKGKARDIPKLSLKQAKNLNELGLNSDGYWLWKTRQLFGEPLVTV